MQVKNLCIETKKGRKLIENLSFNLNEGDKIAVIGEEGNGKSTLLKAIYNQNLISDFAIIKGEVVKNNAKIGYLEQKLNDYWGSFAVFDYFLKRFEESDRDYEIYNKEFVLKKLFKKYNLNEDYLNEDFLIKNLSGGEKVKLQLIKLEFYENDIYFFDEPTNDLDIETLGILERFMLETKKPILFISHDETLLENVANQILHIEQLKRKGEPKHTLKKCGYSEYAIDRERNFVHQTEVALNERRVLREQQIKLQHIKDRVQQAIRDACRKPNEGRILVKKMKNILSQERRFENKDLTEIPEREEAVKLIVDESVSVYNKRKVLDLDLECLMVENKKLADNIKLEVFGSDKVVIIGKNGCGKSTLIKEIKRKMVCDNGLKVGYFSQNYQENLNYEKSLLEEIDSLNSGFNARTVLSTLNFTTEEMEHNISDLSEGQKAKALILKLLISKCNVLLLDEPTRNLSPLSNPVLRSMLKKYNGVVISVSHDRKYITEVCNKIYELTPEGLIAKDYL